MQQRAQLHSLLVSRVQQRPDPLQPHSDAAAFDNGKEINQCQLLEAHHKLSFKAIRHLPYSKFSVQLMVEGWGAPGCTSQQLYCLRSSRRAELFCPCFCITLSVPC